MPLKSWDDETFEDEHAGCRDQGGFAHFVHGNDNYFKEI
jgi:hypothetical protein